MSVTHLCEVSINPKRSVSLSILERFVELGAGVMAQPLTALAALPEELGFDSQHPYHG